MASATSNSSILTNPECYTLSDSTQCSTELNEASTTSKTIVATCKTVKLDAKQTQLVTGKTFASLFTSLTQNYFRNLTKYLSYTQCNIQCNCLIVFAYSYTAQS